MHYGIRRDDLSMIEAICAAEGIAFDWLSEEILNSCHAKRVDAIEIDDAATEEIIRARPFKRLNNKPTSPRLF